jgi:hypothetical protein
MSELDTTPKAWAERHAAAHAGTGGTKAKKKAPAKKATEPTAEAEPKTEG